MEFIWNKFLNNKYIMIFIHFIGTVPVAHSLWHTPMAHISKNIH